MLRISKYKVKLDCTDPNGLWLKIGLRCLKLTRMVAEFRMSSNRILVRDLHCYPKTNWPYKSVTPPHIPFKHKLKFLALRVLNTFPSIGLFWMNEWTTRSTATGLKNHWRITGTKVAVTSWTMLRPFKLFNSKCNIDANPKY